MMRFGMLVSFISCVVFLWTQFGWKVACGWFLIQLYVETERACHEAAGTKLLMNTLYGKFAARTPPIPQNPSPYQWRRIRRPYGTPPA